MVDFIEEVEEQLRADRYRALAQRTLPWFLAALAAIIIGWLGAWGYQTWRNSNIDKASVAYDQAMTALSQGDQTGAFTHFSDIAKSAPGGYKALALMQMANIRLKAGKAQEAADYYDQAAKASPDPMIADLARLKAALALFDTATFAQEELRLKALIGDKKPFDLEAREALAMAKFAAGKTAAAKADCSAITLMLGVTEGVKGRCQSLIAVIDANESQAVIAGAKLAATLPPPQPQIMPAPQGPEAGPVPTAPGTAQ